MMKRLRAFCNPASETILSLHSSSVQIQASFDSIFISIDVFGSKQSFSKYQFSLSRVGLNFVLKTYRFVSCCNCVQQNSFSLFHFQEQQKFLPFCKLLLFVLYILGLGSNDPGCPCKKHALAHLKIFFFHFKCHEKFKHISEGYFQGHLQISFHWPSIFCWSETHVGHVLSVYVNPS